MSALGLFGHFTTSGECPLYPSKRRSLSAIGPVVLLSGQSKGGSLDPNRASLHGLQWPSSPKRGLRAPSPKCPVRRRGRSDETAFTTGRGRGNGTIAELDACRCGSGGNASGALGVAA